MNKITLAVLLIISFAAGIVVGVTVLRSNNTELGQVAPAPISLDGITAFQTSNGCEFVRRSYGFVCVRSNQKITFEQFQLLWEGLTIPGTL